MKLNPLCLVMRATLMALVAAGGVFGQTDSLSLTVYAGVAVSPNPAYDSLVLVEFPYSLNRHELTFYRQDSLGTDRYAYIFAQANLIDSAGLPVDSTSTYFSVRVSSGEEATRPGFRVFDRLVLLARPGTYSGRVTVYDVPAKRRGEYFIERIQIDSVDKSDLTVGGLCLAYNATYVGNDSTGASSRLVKSGFKVVPNPLAMFSQEDDTVMFLYGEVANLIYNNGAASAWELSLVARDDSGNVRYQPSPRVYEKPGATAVFVQSINIADWPAGRYELSVTALDVASNEADTASLQFAILSARQLVLAGGGGSVVDPYDTVSYQTKVDLVRYMLPKDQLAMLERLSPRGKIRFLQQYWEENDDQPETPIHEKRLELLRRYRYSNQHFSTLEDKSDGWLTDRGRIYMTYGHWDELDDRQNPIKGDPYQIWYYRRLKEGKVFVFEDWSGNFDYRLVHSNVYGEIFDQEWDDLIKRGVEVERPQDF